MQGMLERVMPQQINQTSLGAMMAWDLLARQIPVVVVVVVVVVSRTVAGRPKYKRYYRT